MIVAPSKAVNAGGVGVSGLEMSQNSERLVWTAEEVDAQLHKMMKNIHKVSAEAAEEYGLGYDLVAGANIAGFKKVARGHVRAGRVLIYFHSIHSSPSGFRRWGCSCTAAYFVICWQ